MSENLALPNQTDTPVTSSNTVTEQGNSVPQISVEEILKYPEVRALVEAARTQEKNKLYKNLTDKDAEIRQLQEGLSNAQSQLTSKENENLTEMELLQKTIKDLKTQHEALVSSIKSEREAERIKRREAELIAYKERRLREEGNDMVLALVGGNSEEAIDTSIELAKQQYAEIVAKTLEKTKGETPPTKIGTPKVTNPSGTSGVPIRRTDIKSMSDADWAKNRDRIRELASKGQITE